MPTVKQMAKSKTNQFNLVAAPAIVSILSVAGVTVPLYAVVIGYGVFNFILRRVTKKPLSEK